MNKTVKELASELNVSKQTIHRTIQKRNIVTIADGNKILLDDLAQMAIKEDLQGKTVQVKPSGNVTPDVPKSSADVTWNDTERSTDDTPDDFRTIYIDALKIQIEDLKRYIERQDEQLKVKDTQINQLATEIEESRKERAQLTKERQTLLLELLSLRGQSKITTAASAAGTGAAQEPRPQKPRQQSQQPPKKRTLRERVRDFFR